MRTTNTLIGLVLVLASVGLWVQFNRPTDRELLEECKTNMRQLRRIVAKASLDSPLVRCPVTLQELNITLPRCPTAPDTDYGYTSVDLNSFRADFLIRCPGFHPGVARGYPLVTELNGPMETDAGWPEERVRKLFLHYEQKAKESPYRYHDLK